MKRLKVLVVSHTYVVAVNQQKIEALADLPGLEVGLIAPVYWRDKLREIILEKTADSRYQIFPLNAYFAGEINRYFYDPLGMLKVLRKFQPDIIQVEEEPFSWALLELNLLARVFRARTVFFTWQNLRQDYSHLMTLIEKLNFRLSSFALAGNQAAQKILLERGFEKGIEVLCQLGVDTQTFYSGSEPRLKHELELRPNETVIGYVGRFAEEKGVLVLLEACATVVDQLKEAEREERIKLLLLGGGDLLSQIKSVINQKNLGSLVKIVSAVPHHEVPKYLRLMDILVLPSETRPFWQEQFGHVLIEAMATRVAVIGSSSGAIPEVIGGAGLIFPEGDAQALAKSLLRLTQDKNLRRELAEKGYSQVLANFTHQKIAEKANEIYARLVAARKPD